MAIQIFLFQQMFKLNIMRKKFPYEYDGNFMKN